ncbi:ParB/RepB/Spo0J family partition protein [Spirillospora sp. CA-253888]
MPIERLLPGESLRSDGVAQSHVLALSEVEGGLPPILVDRKTMRVVDGMHRLLAAMFRGCRTIEVELFEGTPEEAFLRAVQANVVHGLPLSQADRRAAAARIIMSHPHMSDRSIARASGLGAKTVATLRRSSTAAVPQLNSRIGSDGRIRPVNGEDGRRRVAEVLAERPDASLREVARLAGVSPATAGDVRKRLAAGEEPMPSKALRTARAAEAPPGAQAAQLGLVRKKDAVAMNPDSTLEKLLRDPSLRHKEDGRHLLRLLRQNAAVSQDLMELADVVPAHCRNLVVNLARYYGNAWRGFAELLDEPGE